jgi:hypothetical protein
VFIFLTFIFVRFLLILEKTSVFSSCPSKPDLLLCSVILTIFNFFLSDIGHSTDLNKIHFSYKIFQQIYRLSQLRLSSLIQRAFLNSSMDQSVESVFYQNVVILLLDLY